MSLLLQLNQTNQVLTRRFYHGIFIVASNTRRRWVDNIRMDLQGVGCGHVDWIGLAQDRDGWRTLVSAVMNLRVP